MGVMKTHNGKFAAQCSVGGKLLYGQSRVTEAEAAADLELLLQKQQTAAEARKLQRAEEKEAERAEHASELAANLEKNGGGIECDKLSRKLVAFALADHPWLGVVSGVEYAGDMHLYDKNNDGGFDPSLDVELDASVPTLKLELKMTRVLDRNYAHFTHAKYHAERACLIVFFYLPKTFADASAETLNNMLFLHKPAFGFGPPSGQVSPSIKKFISGYWLAKTLAEEFSDLREQLIPYGERARDFRADSHRKGQQSIDAIEMQVLLPQGARFLPAADGAEGGPEDRVIEFADGTKMSSQIKTAHLTKVQAGFQVLMSRHSGSFRDGNGKLVKTFRPYSVDDDRVELFIYALIDDDGRLCEYWAADQNDLLGPDPLKWLISKGETRGVTGFQVHPHIEDKEWLGDTVANGKGQDEHAVRTRAWIRKLGPITPYPPQRLPRKLQTQSASKCASPPSRRGRRDSRSQPIVRFHNTHAQHARWSYHTQRTVLECDSP